MFGPALRPPLVPRSFWIAGFEGADHRNERGVPLDMVGSTGHLDRLEEDYARLARLGLHSVRESIGWRLAEPRPGRYDFERLRRMAAAARRHGLQVLWTLMHYGAPDGVDLRRGDWALRFAGFAAAVARELRACGDDAPVITPINEISFLAWALAETSMVWPYRHDGSCDTRASGYEVKRHLVHASLLAMQAVRQIAPAARFLHVEPVVHVVPPPDRPDLAPLAEQVRSYQWQAWDMLAGRQDPDLGGEPRWLDVLGLNHYHNGQWEVVTERRLHWHLNDPRRRPFAELLHETWERYRHPLIVAETSHVGVGRPQWLHEIAAQVEHARSQGVPVEGLTLYPIVDRHDWNDLTHWHNSGLWDAAAPGTRLASGATPGRRLCLPYARTLRRWQRRLPGTTGALMNSSCLIVFSHLRWDFVFQRPQQLMSRLAQHWRVVFIEEPVRGDGPARLEAWRPQEGITVLRPHTAVDAPGFHDDQLPLLKPLVDDYLRAEGVDDYVVWFYTPMALPLLTGLKPRAVVYDCMDELANFKGAPRQMKQRESALLKTADLVLTGGPSLFEAKRDANAHVHCFPSGVDAQHFSPSEERRASPAWQEAERLQAHIPGPRLGFFGVLDERLDIGLLAALADAEPGWQVVMVGPVVKIDPATLPQRPNLHYLGMQPYERLPGLVAGWDVCLLPFALNEATQYISPTKTLEYMAAEKPIVSTPIRDVIGMYGDVVHLGHDPAGFVAACRQALHEPPPQRMERVAQMLGCVMRLSWDETARTVHGLIGEAIERRRQQAPSVDVPCAPPPAVPLAPAAHAAGTAPAVREVRHLIIGAGPTGLSAAYHLGAQALLVEREKRVGGWCRSVVDHGFTFDHAGHIMFSNDPYVLALYDKLLGDNIHWQDREAWIYSKGVYTRYPFQGSLHGLPPQVLKECLIGAIEARFGPLKASAGTPASPATPPANFEEFIHRVWGWGIAKHFAIPYNEKLWAVPLREMETSWLGGRVPLPDLEQIIDGALEPSPKPMGPNARFGYPLRGGFQALMDAFVPHLRCELALNTRVVSVAPSRRTVRLDDGRTLRYDTLISTMPLPHLVAACGEEAPPPVQAAARGLRSTSVRCVNLGIARERITDKHWIYYPEDTVFHRIFVQGNASPHCNPPGGFGLTCEITYSAAKPLPCDGEALIARAIEDCKRVGMLREDDRIVCAHQVDMPGAYVVYDHARAAHVACIREWLAGHRIILAGRYAEWEYYNSDHAFLAGRRAAEAALAQSAGAEGHPRPAQVAGA